MHSHKNLNEARTGGVGLLFFIYIRFMNVKNVFLCRHIACTSRTNDFKATLRDKELITKRET